LEGGVQVWVNVEGSLPLAVVEPGVVVVPGQDVRAQGLWLSVTEESAGHWSVQLEAFALALDDPDDAWGVPTPLGLDLEWEDDADGCLVTGEVLVADQRLQIHGRGTRS
jgi:hypothetical protein